MHEVLAWPRVPLASKCTRSMDMLPINFNYILPDGQVPSRSLDYLVSSVNENNAIQDHLHPNLTSLDIHLHFQHWNVHKIVSKFKMFRA